MHAKYMKYLGLLLVLVSLLAAGGTYTLYPATTGFYIILAVIGLFVFYFGLKTKRS